MGREEPQRVMASAKEYSVIARRMVAGDRTVNIMPEVSSGSGPPTAAPAKTGDMFVDTTNVLLYMAIGTSAVSDWREAGRYTYTRTAVTSSPFAALAEHATLAVNVSAPVTIQLPHTSDFADTGYRKQYTIVDEGGNAYSYNITVKAASGELIVGATQYQIQDSYNSLAIYCTAGHWFIGMPT